VTDSAPHARRTDQAFPPRLGAVTLPPLTGPLNTLWDVILDVAAAVPPHRWALIGGQMVTLHALHAGRPPLRVSRDIDVLAGLLTARDGLTLCVTAIRALGLVPAPDHTPPTWPLRTAKGRDTIHISGGRQALQRSALITVTKDDRSAQVPVPDQLGALVLKATAWLEDNRDRERHSHDAALLTSLISDPLAERRRFGSATQR